MGSLSDEFTLAEMMEMESMYKEIGEEALNHDFCQGLASSFSFAPSRAGKDGVTWEQVYNWFQDRIQTSKSKLSPQRLALALTMFADFPKAGVSDSALVETSHMPEGAKVSDFAELQFEAQSSKDAAWYDVATFINYRVLCSGELVARVRFAGYRNTDDEWVNVWSSIRERSIPLEPSECHKVEIGDLVLCFRDSEEQAVYFDAHVLDIQREEHDETSCSCIFHIRYDHDFSEDEVTLERMCRRPSK